MLSSCLRKLDGCFLLNSLSANPEKWSNTLKQIVGNLTTICLSLFDHFVNLALKVLSMISEGTVPKNSKQTLP